MTGSPDPKNYNGDIGAMLEDLLLLDELLAKLQRITDGSGTEEQSQG